MLFKLSIKNIKKSFKGFDLDVEELRIPKGFATALIGENGAGKTTLLRILAGIWLDYTGKIQYFDEKLEDVESVKERLGYTGPNSFFLPQWTIPQIEKISGLLFDNFDSVKYRKLCQELSISAKGVKKKVNSLSAGSPHPSQTLPRAPISFCCRLTGCLLSF